MVGTLESVDWGGPALSLINNAWDLDPRQPAVLHIRHTERPRVTDERSWELLSTVAGRSAASEFGMSLPRNRRYRIYHTVVARTRETAEEIQKGVISISGTAEMAGVIPLRPSLDSDAADQYVSSIYRILEDECAAAVRITNDWCAGLTPPGSMRSSEEFARMVAEFTVSNLKTATHDTLDIYVSHDTWVGNLMWHWFGLPVHADGIKFMDGFLLQPEDCGMTIWIRGEKRYLRYPHWWKVEG